MAALDPRSAWIAGGGIALVALGVVALVALEPDPPARNPAESPKPLQDASSGVFVAPTPAIAGHAVATAPWTPDDASELAFRRYRESTDLRDFYRRALEAGGKNYLLLAQTALLRCMAVARGGMVGAEQRFASLKWEDGKEADRLAAQREWIAPCRGFEANPVPNQEHQRIFARLREIPGATGEAYRMLNEEASVEERKRVVRDVIESSDPELISRFGSEATQWRVGNYRYEGTDEARASNRRYVQEERAWVLASCDLGADCGRGSIHWMNACVKSGDCSDNNAASEVAAEVGRENLPDVLRRKDEILVAIRARDWAALGL